jgi:hypothetical protein
MVLANVGRTNGPMFAPIWQAIVAQTAGAVASHRPAGRGLRRQFGLCWSVFVDTTRRSRAPIFEELLRPVPQPEDHHLRRRTRLPAGASKG